MPKKRRGRKRRKSNASPDTTPNTSQDTQINKKQKQTEIKTLTENSEHSEHSHHSVQFEHSDHIEQVSLEPPDTISETLSEQSEFDYFQDAKEYSQYQESESSEESLHLSILEDTIQTQTQSTENMDDPNATPQSQQQPESVAPQFSTSTPLFQYQGQIPQVHQVSQMPQLSQMPYPQFGISDSDVLRIATVVKQMLNTEIERLVKERVEREVGELKNSLISLEAENQSLKDSISALEIKVAVKVDDVEQYSRRSCLRIVGIDETESEDTDEIVLGLANRLHIDVKQEDIERSHRAGPVRKDTGLDSNRAERVDAAVPRTVKPREIIVKFRNSQARLALLKGRAILRKKKEKLFINEDLTKTRKSIAFECRQLRRENKVQKTWVYNGDVFITDLRGTKVRISHTSELDVYKDITVPKQPSAT